jgi:hypothetical protein
MCLFKTMAHILWSPESDTCSQCGLEKLHVRLCTCGNTQTKFCKGCWSEFILECNVSFGSWREEIAKDWCSNINLRLIFEEDDGTSQENKFFN